MCNACGFLCCAYDGFSRCGCDHCPNPECWDEEDYEAEFGDDGDDDGYIFADRGAGIEVIERRAIEAIDAICAALKPHSLTEADNNG